MQQAISGRSTATIQGKSPAPSTPNGSGGLVRRVTEGDLSRWETSEKARKQAEKEQQKDPMLSIAAHIKTSWDAAVRAKQGGNIEQRLIRALRQRRGIYDPDQLEKIKSFGGSEIYMLLTTVKCRAAESWIRDVLIPPGDKPWSLSPTPIPELPEAMEVKINEIVKNEAVQLVMENGPEAITNEQIAERMGELKDQALREKVRQSKKVTKRFENKIEDELVEGSFYTGLSSFIKDLTTFPTAFLKGPVVRMRKKLVWTEDQNGDVKPAVDMSPRREYYSPSPFDMYPSPGARNVQDGYICERHRLRRTDINAMIGAPGTNEKAIRAVLDEHGTGGLNQWLGIDQERADAEDRPNERDDPDPIIDCVEYWGNIQGKKLLEWGMTKKQVPDPDIDYQICAWLIGQWVIMARLNPHPLGNRPYYAASYEAVNDSIWGRCPGDLMRDLQRICNATARNLINNLAIASGPMGEVYMDRLMPGEDPEDMHPWKLIKSKDSGTGTNNPAVRWFQPNPMAEALLKVYEYFFKQASEQTGIPNYIYGQSDVGGAGKTASGLSMLMNAASKTLKGVIAHIDEKVIKPAIYDHWTHIMLYDDDIIKIGDINVVARASEHLIIAEQLQIRRTEFLDRTANDYDMSIIGKKGRAHLLRETSDSLKFDTEKVVPTEADIIAQERAEMEAAGQPVQLPDGSVVPAAAVIDAAGNQAGQSPGAMMGPAIATRQ